MVRVLQSTFMHHRCSSSYCRKVKLDQNLRITNSGARAMRGFGAMRLLQRSTCVFLAPQCAALRCPWMSALIAPVVRAPSCARGSPCVFVYCTCTTNLCSTIVGTKKRLPRNTNHEIPFNILDGIPQTRRAIFTSSSRSRRQFLTQHPPHGLVVASP